MQRTPDHDPASDGAADPFAGARAVRPTTKRGLRSRLDDLAVVLAVRTGVSPRAVLGLLLVAVVALAVVGVRLAVVRARAVPVLIAPAASSASGATSSVPPVPGAGGRSSVTGPTGLATGGYAPGPGPSGPGAADRPGSAGPGPAGQVVVHVVGQVRRPGVITLGAGSRVRDAVAAAGGATGRADLTAINLARPLVDGEQVLVPRPGQAPVSAPVVPGAGGAGGAGPGGAGPAGRPAVDLNAATLADLDALSGIGPVLAQRILDWRAEHGRFSSVDELTEVSGIGEATLQRIRPQVRV
jgi:competence protein ComEA